MMPITKDQSGAEYICPIKGRISFQVNNKNGNMYNKRAQITVVIFLFTAIFTSCVSKTPTNKEKLDLQELTKNQKEEHGSLLTAEDIQLNTPLNKTWITEGQGVYEVKCQSCHKLTY